MGPLWKCCGDFLTLQASPYYSGRSDGFFLESGELCSSCETEFHDFSHRNIGTLTRLLAWTESHHQRLVHTTARHANQLKTPPSSCTNHPTTSGRAWESLGAPGDPKSSRGDKVGAAKRGKGMQSSKFFLSATAPRSPKTCWVFSIGMDE